MGEHLFCPFSLARDGKRKCLKEDCALWIEDPIEEKEMCSHKLVPKALDYLHAILVVIEEDLDAIACNM